MIRPRLLATFILSVGPTLATLVLPWGAVAARGSTSGPPGSATETASTGPVVRRRREHWQYNVVVVSRGIREFMARDWAAVRQSKEVYWAERIARLGPMEAWRIADELRRQALRRDPQWPDASQRGDDLLFHTRLAERFRRTGATRRA